MQYDINSLPQRITLAEAARIAGYTRKNTIRENFLGTEEERSRLGHRYNHLGESTVETKRFLEALETQRSARAKKGNWRLENLEKANAMREVKRAQAARRNKANVNPRKNRVSEGRKREERG